MDNLLIFAGTTEGRRLAQFLARELQGRQESVHLCVATAYGEKLLPHAEGIHIHTGRLDEGQIRSLMEREHITLAVDATHPYAREVSAQIRAACREGTADYIRLQRRESQTDAAAETVVTDSVREAAEFLAGQTGNIFVATGCKELEAYTVIPDYQKRVYARVLPSVPALSKCERLGLTGEHLVCMQGPFSAELNAALLRETHAAWLVTKDGGALGGFEEKLCAAQLADARLVLVKRPGKTDLPEEESGETQVCTDEFAVRSLLIRRLGLRPERSVSLVGIGMGDAGQMTGEALRTCREAELLIGARRMLDGRARRDQAVFLSSDPEEIAAYVCAHQEYTKAAVLLSGDIGFYSGAKKLCAALKDTENGERIRIEPYCGISSVAYFCGKLGVSWEDARLLSRHGRRENVIAAVRCYPKVFVLCGEPGGVNALCGQLCDYGMGEVRVSVGTDLSYETERIRTGTAAAFAEQTFSDLAVCLIRNDRIKKRVSPGIADDAFVRGKVPMTKEEVRAVSLAKLALTRDAVVWDIGAGTGSVSVEAALLAGEGEVYAVEKDAEAAALLRENRRTFAVDNLHIVQGEAPKALVGLPVPTHVFVGGSGGHLTSILMTVFTRAPGVRLVLNAITIETAAEALACLNGLQVPHPDLVSVSVAAAKEVGGRHMMTGQNPVYILSCGGKEPGKEGPCAARD